MIDILYPDTHETPGGIQAVWKSMRNIREARTVVTISEYSRQRILGLYPMEPSRVCVIPFGVDSDRFRPACEQDKEASRRALGLSGSSFVVLYVGSEQRRKNLGTLIEGLAKYRKKEPDLVFVKAGVAQSKVGRRRFHSDLKTHQMEQATLLMDDLSDDQIVQLYRAADVLAFPSVEEGWGVPVLEAMASSLPVISSRIGPVVEFAGGSVLYVDDPFSPRDWSSTFGLIAADRALRECLGKAGRGKALAFPWDRARKLFTATMSLVGE
jgi:glycosyltransferase involved in cell wall biosynthesis